MEEVIEEEGGREGVAGDGPSGKRATKKDDSEICSPDSLPRFPDEIGGEWGRGTKPGRLRCSGGPRSRCVPPAPPAGAPPLERERGACHTNLKERAISGRWEAWGTIGLGPCRCWVPGIHCLTKPASTGILSGSGNWESDAVKEGRSQRPGSFAFIFHFPFSLSFRFVSLFHSEWTSDTETLRAAYVGR